MLYHHQYAFLCYCIMYQKLLHLHVIVLNKSCTNRSKILSFLFTKYTLLVHRSITSYIIPAFYSSKLRLRFIALTRGSCLPPLTFYLLLSSLACSSQVLHASSSTSYYFSPVYHYHVIEILYEYLGFYLE